MNEYIEQCINCHQWNQSVNRAILNDGFCNVQKTQEWYAKKDTVVVNENPKVVFCVDCYDSIKNSDPYY